MTRDTEKCPLSVLPGVRIKRVNFRENVRAFCRDKGNCPFKAGVHRAGFHCICNLKFRHPLRGGGVGTGDMLQPQGESPI